MSWSEPVPATARRARVRAPLLVGLTLALGLGLAGCGFHLRSSTNLAFSRLAVQGQAGPVMQLLKRSIAATTNATVVDDPRQAQAVFTLLQEIVTQVPTAYNADGTVSQYTLGDTVRFELTEPGGRVLIAPTSISRTSRLSYSTAAALGKADEAAMLYAGMRQSLVDRILFQLSNFHPPADAAGANAPS